MLDYCSAVWGFKKFVKSEAVQNRAIRFFLGVHKFAPLSAINGDVGWDRCNTRWHFEMLRYWNRLIKLDPNRLTKHIFKWDYDLRLNNWSAEIHTILQSIDCCNIFDSVEEIDLNLARGKLQELQSEQWRKEIENKPKLRTYKIFKQEFGKENFLGLNLERSERSFLAKFRCGILPLRIESGRYKGEEVEQRLCQVCQNDEVEDEKHFLFSCEAYSELRTVLFKYIEDRDPSFPEKSMNTQLSSIMLHFSRQLAKYIKNAMLIRSRILYK